MTLEDNISALLSPDSLFKLYSKEELSHLGIRDETFENTPAVSKSNEKRLGAFALNQLYREGKVSYEVVGSQYLSAFVLSTFVNMSLGDMLKKRKGEERIVMDGMVDGRSDLYVSVADIHHFITTEANGTPIVDPVQKMQASHTTQPVSSVGKKPKPRQTTQPKIPEPSGLDGRYQTIVTQAGVTDQEQAMTSLYFTRMYGFSKVARRFKIDETEVSTIIQATLQKVESHLGLPTRRYDERTLRRLHERHKNFQSVVHSYLANLERREGKRIENKKADWAFEMHEANPNLPHSMYQRHACSERLEEYIMRDCEERDLFLNYYFVQGFSDDGIRKIFGKEEQEYTRFSDDILDELESLGIYEDLEKHRKVLRKGFDGLHDQTALEKAS